MSTSDLRRPAPRDDAAGRHRPQLARAASRCVRHHPRPSGSLLALHCAAALAGLVAPRLLGEIVEAVQTGTTAGHVDVLAAMIAAALVAQTLLTRAARYRSLVLGEEVLAETREHFVDDALALPLGTVESAGSGDLLTRTSRDVDQLGWSVRWALPEWLIAVVTALLTVAAALLVGPWVAMPLLARRARRWSLGAAVVPAPGQGRLPPRERVVLRDQRHAHRDRRGRAHRGGARPEQVPHPRGSTATSPGRSPPSGTRCGSAPGSSRPSRSRPTSCRAWPPCCSAAGSTSGAR